MLSIAQDAVRGRALSALDSLGPPTDLDAGERQLICDYLLSQLPDAEHAVVRDLLAGSPSARTWALALTPALEPVAVDPLPRIPPATAAASGGIPRAPGGDAPAVTRSAPGGAAPAVARSTPGGAARPAPAAAGEPSDKRPPSSRTGGIVVIALALAVIIAAIVVLLVTGHHNDHSGRGLADASHISTTTDSSTTTSSSTSAVKYVAQINLHPVAAGSKAVGVAVVVRDGSTLGIEMFGEHIPPNSKRNSYEVWLYSSPTHFEKLGFVSPAVGRSGRFSAVNPLPKNAGGYRELIVTTETARKPTHPGPVLLHGTITGLS